VIEEALAAIWAQVLGERDAVGINDSFLELGGDSLQATAMFLEIERLLGRRLPVASLIAAPTIATLAEAMSQEADVMPKTCLVPIQPRGSRRPLVCLPGMHGNVFNFYPLARRL
jgi:acyl carrier protein